MQKIYWFVQQLNFIGGTEMVSIELMKHLSKTFDVTLVSVSEISDDIAYDIDDLKVISLNVPQSVCRYDAYLSSSLKAHHYWQAVKLTSRLIDYFVFKRNHYRQKICALTNKDDLIIASSMDSYIYAPLERHCIFHYHFNGQTYLSLGNRLMSLLARKNDYTVFLTKDTYDYVVQRKKAMRTKATYIYNPSRFKCEFVPAHTTPQLLFMGRLEKQKNPMRLLRIASELKEADVSFHLDILGDGSYANEMQQYIDKHALSAEVAMHGQVTDIEPFLRKNDINLLTSTFEGFPLSIIEATSYGLYNISTNWGDAVHEAIDGNNGIVIDSFDEKIIAKEIIHVLNKDLNQLKYQSYCDAQRFDISSIVQEWIKLINKFSKENK